MVSAISVCGLCVSYRNRSGKTVQAVEDLSFAVAPGEVVGFLGPNGAGKSSTLKALMGFVIPDAGNLSVFGQDCGSVESRRRTGYLPEVALYYPYLTPMETMVLYGELQGLRGKPLRSEARDLLEQLGIGAAANKQNRTLSKGMLQRVGIAQALLGDPELLILDEVTSGIDPVGRKELRTLLKERQQQGVTIFFSSHELAEVEALCDRLILIDKGQLIEEREMMSLKYQLREFGVVYSGNTSMVGLTDDLEALNDGLVECRFESKEQLLEAVERIRKDGGTIHDLVARDGSLEDYFVHRIGEAA